MTERSGQIDIKSKAFEESAQSFQLFVQAVALGVGGEEEYTLRGLGRQIVRFHSLPDGEEREKAKEEIGKTFDTIGKSKNPKAGEAVVNLIMMEASFF